MGAAIGNTKLGGAAQGANKFNEFALAGAKYAIVGEDAVEWSGQLRKGVSATRVRFFGARLSTGLDDPSLISGFQLPTNWAVGGASLYVRIITLNSLGSFELRLDDMDTGAGGGQDDLIPALETSLQVQITAGGRTLNLTMNGNTDLTEPYLFTPSNSAELIAFIDNLSNGLHATTIKLVNPSGSSTPSPTHTFTIGIANAGYNGIANRGTIDSAAYATPGGKNVTVIHCRAVGSELNFALSGAADDAADFPTRIVAKKTTGGEVERTFIPQAGSRRSVRGGIRQDYDPQSGAVGDVFVNNQTVEVKLYYG